MPRLFVGTFLSEEGAEKLSRLAKANAHLDAAWNTKVRWVGSGKLHITWLFLGEIKSEVIADLTESLSDAVLSLRSSASGGKDSEQNTILRYEKLELWPNERKAKLAVITPGTVPDEIDVIAKAIKKALKSYVPRDQQMHEHKSFKPHLTVFRFSRDHGKSSKQSILQNRKHQNIANRGNQQVLHQNVLHAEHENQEMKSRQNLIRTADIIVPDSIFPVEHCIDEIALIESDMGKQTQGYEKLAAYRL